MVPLPTPSPPPTTSSFSVGDVVPIQTLPTLKYELPLLAIKL
jgi:hypothetical protein